MNPYPESDVYKKALRYKIRQKRLAKLTYQVFDLAKKEKNFLAIIILLLVVNGYIVPYPHIARWAGFIVASYSVISNDSIQTIGTFIASNRTITWWYLWLFMGFIFIGTVTYSWITYQGDISYQRLMAKGLAETPQTFSFLQLAAPIVLLVLTRIRIPISTTCLLLNMFTVDTGIVVSILQKSMLGYCISFFIALIVWYSIAKFAKVYWKPKPRLYWFILQWIISGLLWSSWIIQDAANIAVFLPRSLSLPELLLCISIIFLGLGILFYLRGDRIQQIVDEKAGIKDIRAAILVDFVYILILFYFKNLNNLPMSTTWVFIGLLGGRELAHSFTKTNPIKQKKALQKSIQCIKKDLRYACIGLLISILLSTLVNPTLQKSIQQWIDPLWPF